MIVGLEETVEVQTREAHRYGTAGYGPNLFQEEVWQHECHVFAAGGDGVGLGSGVIQLGHPDRTASNSLNRYPVDVLAVDESGHKRTMLTSDRYWVWWMDRCETRNYPKYLMVATAPQELVDDDGLQSKSW
jgi:hypothetical protein